MERYKIIHHLGSGSFGNVVVGLEKASDRKVAIKFVGKIGKREKDIQNLKKEWETHKNLRHPNVILMLDSFETADSIVVVTELAHGDLYKIAPQYSRWQAGAVQKIACDLVSALHCLHSQRILHRDLKPQNILIGFDGMAKLCDFGFAKAIGMNSFMLTSMKGTPLYMAPEIIMEQPYDQTADLWSLGCILYELFVGEPPFHTNSLFVLRKKLIEENIIWHDCIPGDALHFLQGLLEKDPKKRLTWPDLLIHPYVHGKLLVDKSVADFALTKALTQSQELVKETERQQLQKELEQCSKNYRKAMKKYAQAQRKLKRWNSEVVIGRGRQAPFDCAVAGDGAQINKLPTSNNPSVLPCQKADNLEGMFQNLNVQADQGDANNTQQPKVKDRSTNEKSKCEQKKLASPTRDVTASSSDCETESDDEDDSDDRDTVILDSNRKSNGNSVEIMVGGSNGFSDGGGVLFTLDTSGSTEFKIDSAEWLDCIMKTMKELLEDPQSLCQKGILQMVVGPLKNTSTEPIVLEKIAVLLSLPFTLDETIYENYPGLISDLQRLYLDTKVLPLLLFACKLIIVNRASGLSLTFEKISELLTEEDLSGLEKCFRLVTFLVHIDENFVTQFCDSVCVLKLPALLQLFLKLDVVRTSVTADTVAVLCHLLRVFPNNKSIVEDVVLGLNDEVGVQDELWRLLAHSNPLIQSKSIRLFSYLFVTSSRVKLVETRRPFVWNILGKAIISSDNNLRDTAKFAIQTLTYNKRGQRVIEKLSNMTISVSTTTTHNSHKQNLETKTTEMDDGPMNLSGEDWERDPSNESREEESDNNELYNEKVVKFETDKDLDEAHQQETDTELIKSVNNASR